MRTGVTVCGMRSSASSSSEGFSLSINTYPERLRLPRYAIVPDISSYIDIWAQKYVPQGSQGVHCGTLRWLPFLFRMLSALRTTFAFGSLFLRGLGGWEGQRNKYYVVSPAYHL